jgi:hypothetical protein
LWESERFVVFPVVFDPTGIATLARWKPKEAPIQ